MAEIPQLYTCAGGGQRLMVDGRPYTLFAGECHNSASGGRRALRMLSIARGRSV